MQRKLDFPGTGGRTMAGMVAGASGVHGKNHTASGAVEEWGDGAGRARREVVDTAGAPASASFLQTPVTQSA